MKKEVVGKDLYNAKIKNIEDKIPDITILGNNTSLNAKINEVKNELPCNTNLPTRNYGNTNQVILTSTTTAVNAKINEVKNKTLNITKLTTTLDLTAAENKIPNVSNLVKKTDYNTITSKIESKIFTDHDLDKYITTQELSKLTTEILLQD